MIRLAKLACASTVAAALTLALTAAQRPAVLAQAQGGLWEISGARDLSGPSRLCLADPALLAQIEHRNARCTRQIIRDQPGNAEIHYSCAAGGFGQTRISMITPRALRVETQGISGNAPFHYVVQARRVGNCPGH